MNTDIKLVALDLDRTTLNSESHLSEVNRHCLRMSYQFPELNMQ